MNDQETQGTTNDVDSASVDRVVLPSDVEIDVWEVWPHLNTDYDYAIFDDHTRAIEYAKEVVSSFIDDAGPNDELEMKIKHTTMTRGDFDQAYAGD
jgi:hypothetical protein